MIIDKLYELKGTNGIIIAYEDRTVISRNTLTGFTSQGGATGEKTYYYQDLANIEFKKANFFSNGYIKFILKGTNSRQAAIGLMGTSMQTFQDPDTVTFRAFRKDIPEQSEHLYYILTQKLSEYKKNEASAATAAVGTDSKMDELQKLADLKERGILTETEFEAEKQKILNS